MTDRDAGFTARQIAIIERFIIAATEAIGPISWPKPSESARLEKAVLRAARIGK